VDECDPVAARWRFAKGISEAIREAAAMQATKTWRRPRITSYIQGAGSPNTDAGTLD
jgi:hypothetical protein